MGAAAAAALERSKLLALPHAQKGRRTAGAHRCPLDDIFPSYTMCRELADKDVPYLGELKAPHATWNGALRHWLDGHVLCEEVKRYVGKFMAVTRVRPDGDEPDDFRTIAMTCSAMKSQT